MHEAGARLAGCLHQRFIHLVGQELVDALFPHVVRLAHRDPDVGIDEISSNDCFQGVDLDADACSCGLRQCAHLFHQFGGRLDPGALEWRNGVLWHGEQAIDLVYNRLTDFYLEEPNSAALREAYVQEAVVLAPHPQAHALYADKRRLALFSDSEKMQALGVPQAVQRILLEHVPSTELVKAADAQRLWDARRNLFFKPVAGFGSRAAYRGDKLTKRVWQEILAGEYVAQAIVSPGERLIDNADAPMMDVMPSDPKAPKAMKFDLRAYAYGGDVQWVAARLYQGQTTNFRTPGGGFAPVYSTAESWGRVVDSCDGDLVDQDKESAYASFVFLLDSSDEVHPVPHGLYVALARGDATIEAMAGRTLRVADWYVRLNGGRPKQSSTRPTAWCFLTNKGEQN